MSTNSIIDNQYLLEGRFDFNRFRAIPLPTEQQITSDWKEHNKPLVSILCATFNHADFIEDALRGFLLQETDFPFEVIVHDDASTDGTTEIIRKYQERYQSIIKHVVQPVNLYSKGASPTAIALDYSRGEYICLCEGDDFWIDRNKLASQAQTLRSHPGIAISGHDAIIIGQDGLLKSESKLNDEYKSDKSATELLGNKVRILTLTWMVRRNALYFPEHMFKTINRDTFLTSIIGQSGGSKYEENLMPAVYRAHPGGAWSSLASTTQNENLANTMFWLHRFHRLNSNQEISDAFASRYLDYILRLYSLRDILKAKVRRIKFL